MPRPVTSSASAAPSASWVRWWTTWSTTGGAAGADRVGAVRRSIAALGLLIAASGSSSAQHEDCIVLENFASSSLGAFPAGWAVRAEEGRAVYTVLEDNGRRFLHALARGVGVQAGARREWDLARYPMLVWWWRPVEFPAGADERSGRTNDSVLAVYLLVASSSLVGPK